MFADADIVDFGEVKIFHASTDGFALWIEDCLEGHYIYFGGEFHFLLRLFMSDKITYKIIIMGMAV